MDITSANYFFQFKIGNWIEPVDGDSLFISVKVVTRIQNTTKQEQTDWLDALLLAITSEAVRLSDRDMAGFASRVAMRAPAPENKKPIVNGEENGL